MKIRNFASEIWLPAAPSSVFQFFADAGNLNRITPTWLHFRMLTPADVSMKQGTLIDYSLKIRGIPVRWQSRIEVWEPPDRFVDAQVRGPYKKWAHTHEFQPQRNGTLVKDSVQYAVGGWILEPFVSRYLVRPDLELIFEFRRSKLNEIFRLDGPKD